MFQRISLLKGRVGKEQETTGFNGKQRETTGNNGKQRETTGNNGKQRNLQTLSTPKQKSNLKHKEQIR
jgi:hypothetical protein